MTKQKHGANHAVPLRAMLLIGMALGTELTLIVLYAAHRAVRPEGAPLVAAMAAVAMFVLNVVALAMALAEPKRS